MSEDSKPIEITLLTQENCDFCEQAKELLGRLSQEFPLMVTDLDLNTKEAQDLALKGGMLFPPGILIDGQPFSYGRPSERKLRRGIEKARIKE